MSSVKRLTSWTDAQEIKNTLLKKWQNHSLLRDHVLGKLVLPLTLPLKRPKNKELGSRFVEVRAWIQNLYQHSKAASGKKAYQIHWQQLNVRSVGSQKIPQQVVFESYEDVFAYIGQQQAFSQFENTVAYLLQHLPESCHFALKPALAKHVGELLKLNRHTRELLNILLYFLHTEKIDGYIRELDIPEVDSKFIEQHKKLLNTLLLAVLPESHYDKNIQGMAKQAFERRFGLRYDAPLIRFRILDQHLYLSGMSDISLPIAQFRQLLQQPGWPVRRVFITENKINGLSFPDQPSALVIFGLGYGISSLANLPLLRNCPLFYWGDIDTHGYAILDQFRGYYPAAQSLLMDQYSLLACQKQWGREVQQSNANLKHLNNTEQNVYQGLLEHRWAENLRLEQERIPFSLLEQAIIRLHR